MRWLNPWHPIEQSRAAGLERELEREAGREHPLFAVKVSAIAHRQDCDDVLFALHDGTSRVAVVHLTWTSSPPERPPWPGTTLYSSFDAWVDQGMVADHLEFGADS